MKLGVCMGVLICLASCAPLTYRIEWKDKYGGTIAWEDGIHYCNRLAVKASSHANQDFIIGLGLGVLGLGSAGAATVMSGTITNPDFKDRVIEAALPLATAAALVLSKVFFSREKAAAELAAVAHRNAERSERDQGDQILRRCLEARARWEESREDAIGIVDRAFEAPPGGAHPPATAPALVPATAPALVPATAPALVPAIAPAIVPATAPALAPATAPALAPATAAR